jgi:hypothetical protein
MALGFEFIGNPDIPHVVQPPGSELCFAAIISAVSGASVPQAQEVLVARRLSSDKGTLPIIGEKRLEVGGSVVTIEPFQSPFGEGADNPQGAIELIDEQLVALRSVTLLYKKNNNPDDDQLHWTLLTGYLQNDGRKGSFHAMDPLRPRPSYYTRPMLASMIRRSMDFNGVFAYALSTTKPD